MEIEYNNTKEYTEFIEFIEFVVSVKKHKMEDFIYIKETLFELEKEDR
ncbi:hypothetical protein KGF47_18130 [Clostridioides sp. ZZV13-5731]|nr:hypothetical protein [Clostridioides sp. ZZV13-5731]